jgi:hypothetical protein
LDEPGWPGAEVKAALRAAVNELSTLPGPGVSDERCKWPNTLSCALARKGRYGRNTVGRESTVIEGSG